MLLSNVPIEAKKSIAEFLGPFQTANLLISTKTLRAHYLNNTEEFFQRQLIIKTINPKFDFTAYPARRRRGIVYGDAPWIRVAVASSTPIIKDVLREFPEFRERMNAWRWKTKNARMSLFVLIYAMELGPKHLYFLTDPNTKKQNSILKFVFGLRRTDEVMDFYLRNSDLMKELFMKGTINTFDTKWLDDIGLLYGLKNNFITQQQFRQSYKCKWTNMLAFVYYERRFRNEPESSFDTIRKSIAEDKMLDFRRGQQYYPDWTSPSQVRTYIEKCVSTNQKYEPLKLNWDRLNIIGPGFFTCIRVTERSTGFKRVVFLFGEEHNTGDSKRDGEPNTIHVGEFIRKIIVDNPSSSFDTFLERNTGKRDAEINGYIITEDERGHIQKTGAALGYAARRSKHSDHPNLRYHNVDVRMRSKIAKQGFLPFALHYKRSDEVRNTFSPLEIKQYRGIKQGESMATFQELRKRLRIDRQMRWMDPTTRAGLEQFLIERLTEFDSGKANTKRAVDTLTLLQDAFFLARSLRKFRDGSHCENIFGFFGFAHAITDIQFFLKHDLFETKVLATIPEYSFTSRTAKRIDVDQRDESPSEFDLSMENHYVDISKYLDKLEIVC